MSLFLGGGVQLPLRGSETIEQGKGVGGGTPPPTMESFLIFRLEEVQFRAYGIENTE